MTASGENFLRNYGTRESKEGRESFKEVSTVRLFVFRHARSEYKERESIKKFGKWAPKIDDITELGKVKLKEVIERVADEIDPSRDIVFVLSSPRARSLRTKELIANGFAERGIEVKEGGGPFVEILRSGGDNAPLVGKENEVIMKDAKLSPEEDFSIELHGVGKTKGARFRQFLSFFSALDKRKLNEKVKDSKSIFHGKRPVFLAITHGEVLHGGGVSEDYPRSFLGQAFPGVSGVKLPRGEAMKLEFDLNHPGDFSLTIPEEVNPKRREEVAHLHFDSTDGTIARVKDYKEDNVESELIVKSKEPGTDWNVLSELLPKTLQGTTFEVPYEALPAKKLVTRTEFARELGDEMNPYVHVGRKVNRKSFIHPLSGEEFLVVKSNRGNSPQLFFSYIDGRSTSEDLTLNNEFMAEKTIVRQRSRFDDLIKDDRVVRLLRVAAGTNVKGKEQKTYFYLDPAEDSPAIHALYTENVFTAAGKEALSDYVTQNFVLLRDHAEIKGSVFFKVQSRRWEGETLVFVGRYTNGELMETAARRVSLEHLPYFDEVLKENPEAIFDLFRITSENPDAVSGSISFNSLDKGEAVLLTSQSKEGDIIDVDMPKVFDSAILFSALRSGVLPKQLGSVEISKKVKDDYEKKGVFMDPEVDRDLADALGVIQEAFGESLQEVFFYGSIPRGYKHFQSDIDLLAVVNDEADLVRSISGFKIEDPSGKGKLLHNALGSYSAKSHQYVFRNIEVHTIHAKKLKKPNQSRLGDFLRNVLEGAIRIYP